MYYKFSNFICQIHLNIYFGNCNFFYFILFGIFLKNVNSIKQKKSELINMIILLLKYYK
jgi:hypothetical protein